MAQYSERVTNAIAEGIAICSRSIAPEVVADLFIRYLANDPDWSEEEVSDVRDYLKSWLACLDTNGRKRK